MGMYRHGGADHYVENMRIGKWSCLMLGEETFHGRVTNQRHCAIFIVVRWKETHLTAERIGNLRAPRGPENLTVGSFVHFMERRRVRLV
jgi:hypothetical protein